MYSHLLILMLLFTCSDPSQETLVWSEEFEGSELDESRWNFALGDGCPELCGWGNAEPQLYTRDNHKLEDGKLHITVKREAEEYTSTRINTKNKFEFQYGRVEARAKLPKGKGVWPALWMLGSNIDEVGWPLCGEIDILEYVGREPGQVFNSLHTANSHGNTINTRKTRIENIEEGFHTYVMDWTEHEIRFYVDGDLMYTFNPTDRSEEVWPFDQPFYLLVNLAISGNFGGHDIDDSVLPQEFIIDYIRVYRDQ